MNRSRTAEARIRATTFAITPQKEANVSPRKYVQPTPFPTITWPLGIYACEIGDTVIRFAALSCWHGRLDGEDISVLAGTKPKHTKDDPKAPSGIVLYRKKDEPEAFWLPEAEGLLTITAVTWPHITVRSAIGKEHGFNAETLEWETPQATPTTPTPTGTPTP